MKIKYTGIEIRFVHIGRDTIPLFATQPTPVGAIGNRFGKRLIGTTRSSGVHFKASI
jgi:hypothetical protein